MKTIDNGALRLLQARYGANIGARKPYWRPVYDYVRFPAAGTTLLRFFQVGLGGADPVSGQAKTYEQTSVRRSGQLDNPVVITQIGVHAQFLPIQRQTANAQAVTTYAVQANSPGYLYLENLKGRGVLEVGTNNRVFQQIPEPLMSCPPGGGVEFQNFANQEDEEDPAGPERSFWSQQQPDDSGLYILSDPMLITPEDTLNVSLSFPRGNPGAIPALANDANNTQPAFQIGVIFHGWELDLIG